MPRTNARSAEPKPHASRARTARGGDKHSQTGYSVGEWVPVSSSAVARFRYSARSRALRLVFTIGKTYTYYGVTASEMRDFVAAPSKRALVNTDIKPNHPSFRPH